ncbi:thiosulfate sulfurtransferase GlpE [Neptunomonas phycophila]|uniref:thiosulfate sulfurtransferase GlpE n=1 Tax=Neptunomonas phycophila TaxID=1572645 RepID=UPI0015B85A78|nr:thiosulfate sulfurtransferase GlpE [Neptunomonas phycophila]QLE96807.1 thiosulfate sulfurtransferase GlpE [Neptunomonas phycophila]
MAEFRCINADEAITLMDEGAAITDIRDSQSFAAGHITGALHLNNDNLEQVLHGLEFDTPVIVCCYHGISSQSAAAFLVERGFENVASLNGGFEEWRVNHADKIES